MNIVDLRVYRDAAFTPLVILVDAQQEYLAPHRGLHLPGAGPAVENCRRLVRYARLRGFPMVFTRWVQRGKFFAPSQGFSDWIDELAPLASEAVCERSMPSCYASSHFSSLMAEGGGENAVIAGFAGSVACLATVIDAYHRHHRLTFLRDASASHTLPTSTEAETHRHVTEIIRLYANVETTDAWIGGANIRNEVTGEAQL